MMGRLISSEWYKLVRSRFFYVCILVNAIFSSLFIISIRISGDSYGSLLENSSKKGSSSVVQGLFDLVEFNNNGNPAWAAAYGIQSSTLLIGVILVILFLSMEYKKGTMLMMVSRGYSRKKIMLARILVALAGLWIMMLTNVLISGITGIFLWGFPPETADMIGNMFCSIACNFIMVSGAAAPGILLAVLLQNSGEAIGIYVVLNLVINNGFSVGESYHIFPDYFVSLFHLENQIAEMANILHMPKIPWTGLFVSIFYLISCGIICSFVIEKKDLG